LVYQFLVCSSNLFGPSGYDLTSRFVQAHFGQMAVPPFLNPYVQPAEAGRICLVREFSHNAVRTHFKKSTHF
jgi:hypothetical protein